MEGLIGEISWRDGYDMRFDPFCSVESIFRYERILGLIDPTLGLSA